MTLMIGEYTLVGNVDEILEFMRKNTPCVPYGTITPSFDSNPYFGNKENISVSTLAEDEKTPNKPINKPQLLKEGDQFWDPETGNIYDSSGVLFAHDCVYRGNR